jgi:hypothetical protein
VHRSNHLGPICFMSYPSCSTSFVSLKRMPGFVAASALRSVQFRVYRNRCCSSSVRAVQFQFSDAVRCVVVPFSGELPRRHCVPFPPKPPPFESWNIPLAQLVDIPARQRPGCSPSSSKVTASSCRFSVLHLSEIQLTAGKHHTFPAPCIHANPNQQPTGYHP